MRRFVPFFVIAVVALLVGFVVGWIQAGSVSATRLERVVAMRWGDGKYGPSFYGAHVYLEPVTSGYSVRARIYIGRGNDYFYDCGELGKVQTDSEAVARWSAIDWREDGLHIGSGTNHYFLPKAKMERHR
ncbi:MAG: hypothetical protein HY301_10720 [Verrucomicrobia bacterium]|nr:hypothetical protein [Verrucomicrobiota bacterium]